MQDNINHLLEKDSNDDNAIVMMLTGDIHLPLKTNQQHQFGGSEPGKASTVAEGMLLL